MSRPTPKINIRRFEHALKFVDAHTCGEFCRIIYDGFDEPEGNTMMEKKKLDEKKQRLY